MQDFFLEARGLAYRTNEFVPGRKTLLLIHGLSGSSSAWAPFESAWEGEYNVLSFDLRGHGWSQKPPHHADYALESLTDDVEALLDHVGVSEFTVLSQSYATLIAVLLIRRRPQAVHASVFMSSTYGIYSIFLTNISRAVVHAAAHLATLIGQNFAYSRTQGWRVDYSHFRHAGDWNFRRIFTDIPNTTWHVWLWCLDHAYAQDLDPLWKDVRVPTLIVHGKKDSISPVASAYRLKEALPHAQLNIIEHSSHVFPLTHSAEAIQIASKFLQGI